LINQIIDLTLYAWDDQFADLSAVSYNNLNTVITEPYVYTADLQNTPVYHEFASPVTLLPNQRYLLCITTYDLDVFFGHDTRLDYRLNLSETGAQPIMAIQSDATWFNGFTTPAYPAILLNMIENNIGLEELEIESIEVYPNPATEVLNIPMKGWDGMVALKAHDITGRQVISTSSAVVAGDILSVDVSHLSAGTYTITLANDKGRVKSFSVMINR
jgi:hypothetical protein